jgi:hypothetical protein
MNEIQTLRNQLDTEHRHVREVVRACAAAHGAPRGMTDAAALAAFSQACAEYLECLLGWFEARDQRLAGLYAALPADDPGRRALAALGERGSGAEALKRLAAGAAPERGTATDRSAAGRWQELAQFVAGAWDGRREAIDALLASNPRVTYWRTFSRVDADSIVEERSRYARVRATLPPGVELAGAPAQVG